MGLVRTAPLVGQNGTTTASAHRDLLLAIDELLDARFSSKSWKVFTVDPQLPFGTRFIFGTLANLDVPGAAYDPSLEDPDAPDGGSVVSHDPATKVVYVTGYSSEATLNRRRVWWSPDGIEPESWWWLATQPRPDRWLPLGLADICIEGYTGDFASDTASFEWQEGWDRYGCVRIHNGNRHALTVTGASVTPLVIPPYGVICGRRTAPDGPFDWASTKYLPLTEPGDPLKWEVQFDGQPAASMDVVAVIMETVHDWCRLNPQIDSDSTARFRGVHTGANPAGTDYAQDWLNHKGVLLSVVLDKRDGSTVVTPLQWDGVGTTWPGHVEVTMEEEAATPDRVLRFTSDSPPPAGADPEDWEHDIIPLSTDVTQGAILSIREGPADVLRQEARACGGWCRPLGPVPFSLSTQDVYWEDAAVIEVPVPAISAGIGVTSTVAWSDTLAEVYGMPAHDTEFAEVNGGYYLSSQAIGRWSRVALDASVGLGNLTFELMHALEVDLAPGIRWILTSIPQSRLPERGFRPDMHREYQSAGEVVGGSATYYSHPQDTDLQGTPDGLGGELGWEVQPLQESAVRIAGGVAVASDTVFGRPVWLSTEVLHTVHENLDVADWWHDNRDRILAGTLTESEKLLTWRLPRTIEQFNDYARAVNAVREVHRATIAHLYREPFPQSSVEQKPFERGTGGAGAFAVPYGWIGGRYDTGDTLQDWADHWSVDLETELPDLDDLRAVVRKTVVRDMRSRPARAFWDGTVYPDDLPDPNPGDHNYPPFGVITIFVGVLWQVSSPVAETPLFHALPHGNFPYAYRIVDYSSWFTTESTTSVNDWVYSSWIALQPADQTTLFGNSGTDVGYKWLEQSAANEVFGPMGVPLPPVPMGERYNPRLANASSVAWLQGDSYASQGGGVWQEIETTAHAATPFEVHIAYREASASGTWIRVIRDVFDSFRIVDAEAADESEDVSFRRRHYEPYGLISSPVDTATDWQINIIELVHDGDEVPYTEASPYGILPRDSASDDPAWPTLRHITADYPILIQYAPEPWVLGEWDMPQSQAEIIASPRRSYTPIAETGPMRLRLMSDTDLPLTPGILRGGYGAEGYCFHGQAIACPGVLRLPPAEE